MPFQIKKQPDGKYKLYNLHKKEYAKASFKTKESAAKQGINYMRYRGEKGKVVGNKILKVGKKK
tara:strand:+ start:1580 stop:1771 length:192 start_codon:yes stop_codon:yes gene_type:complete